MITVMDVYKYHVYKCSDGKVMNKNQVCIEKPDVNKNDENAIACYATSCSEITNLGNLKCSDLSTSTLTCIDAEPFESTSGTKPCKEQEIPNTISSIVISNNTSVINETETEKALKETVSISTSSLQKIENTTSLSISTTTTPTEYSAPTTIAKKETIETTIINNPVIKIPTTIIEKKEEKKEKDETLVILLTFTKLVISSSNFTFTIIFITIKNSMFSKTLIIIIIVIYNTYLRRMENYEAVCTLDKENSKSMMNYKCSVQIPTANIKQIKIKGDYEFDPENNIKLTGISPLGKMAMDDLQSFNDKYGNLITSNTSVFILDNATISRNEDDKVEISGKINEEKPQAFSLNKNLTLFVGVESEPESEKKLHEINCTIKEIENNNCTLLCQINEKVKYNLQSSIAYIDDGLLLVNFMDFAGNSTIIEPNTEKEIHNSKYYFGKSNELNGATISAIILSIVAILAALIASIYCFRKKAKINDNVENESNFDKLKL